MLYDQEAATALRTLEAWRMQQSTQLMPDEWKRRGLAVKTAENIARLFSPLL